MLWQSYKYVAVPLILIIHLVICVAQILLNSEPDSHQNVIVVLALTLLIPLAAFLTKMASMPSSLLPEAPKGAFRLLWLPLLIESLKFSIVYISSRLGGPNTVVYHAGNMAIVLLCCVIVLTLIQNAPIKMERYTKLYKYLQIWEDLLLEPSLPDKVKHHGSVSSVSSHNSAETNAPAFNLDSFSKRSISQSKLMPILSSNLHCTSDTMDRMYSISPKNTLHLVSDAESLCEPDYGNPYSVAFNDQLAREAEAPLDGKDAPCDPNCSFSESLELNDPSVRSNPQFPVAYTSCSSSTFSSASSKSLRMSFLGWFKWLIPFEFSKKRKPKSFYKRLQRVQIKQKLSTYNLNSNDTSSLLSGSQPPLYGSFDLESQTFKPAYKRQFNCHDYFDFAAFSNTHFDDWATPANRVDPIFKKFGVTFEELPTVYFVAHVIELVLAQFVSLMTFALPFFLALPFSTSLALIAVVFICHLFCINFLKHQSESSYKVNIVLALLIRMATFGALLLILQHYI